MNGVLLLISNDVSGAHLVMFEIFGEIWISFRGTQLHDIIGILKVFL